MDSYEKEMVLYYTNLWGSTGQPTFSSVPLETIAEKNNDAALLLFFIHHLKGENGDVISACKKVINYVRPETPGSDIFDELPSINYSESKGVQTDDSIRRPIPIFPSIEDKETMFSEKDFPNLSEAGPGTRYSPEDEDEKVTEISSGSDTESELDIPEVTGVVDKEVKIFDSKSVTCGKVPVSGQIYFIKFYIENEDKENVIYLTKDQVPDIRSYKRGSIYSISGKFKYNKERENWVFCDDGELQIKRTQLRGVQEVDKTRKSNKIITSYSGETFFLSDTEQMKDDGPCSFEIYKMNGKNSYSACNLKRL